MEIIRATKTAEQAGAYYVRIQAMARKHKSAKHSPVTEWRKHKNDGDTKMYVI